MKKIKTGDKVKVVAGAEKGTISDVEKVDGEKVYVKGVNVRKKAIQKQGFKEVTMPIHISNVMYYSEKDGKAVRVGFDQDDGKKVRINKKTGEKL